MRTRLVTWIVALACNFWTLASAAGTNEPVDPAQPRRAQVLRQLDASQTMYTTPAAWTTRRAALREGFLKGAGLWPLPERTPLQPVRHSRREHDGYSVENVALETMPGFYCAGNLYRPLEPRAPTPGILSPHGHFRPEGRWRRDQQLRCAHLARMGAAVFSYSMVGWQEADQTTHDDPLVLALQTWNSLRAVDFLCEQEGVDPERIGITGASGGGTQAVFAALLDDRVRAAAPVVIVYPWTAPDGCRCEGGLPVMQEAQTNIIELAAACAPRPQLLISVGGDQTRDFPQVGFPFIRHVYDLHGHSEAVDNVHLPEEEHDFGPSKRQALYEFFARHFELSRLPEEAGRITLEPPAVLRVFDDAHPRPAHAIQGAAAVAQAFRELRRPASDAAASDPPVVENALFTPAGFDAPGSAVTAEGAGTGALRVTVSRAGSGRPTPCRMNIVGPDGNYYQPPADELTPYALTGDWPRAGRGNRAGKSPHRYWGRYFYSRGESTVVVPPGRVRVEVWKGLEHRPQARTVEVAAGETTDVRIELAPTVELSELGYYSGDPHLHLNRRHDADDQVLFDLLEAEDVRYGSVLAYNEPAGPYIGEMGRMDTPQHRGLGERSIRRRGDYHIASGQEYRSGAYGHLNLYYLSELTHPGQRLNADAWPLYGEVGRAARAAGGFAFYAHGGYSQAIYADFAQRAVHGVELLQFGVYRGIGLEDWYRMLNAGYQFPCVGASDYPACRKFGDCLTYVHHARTPTFHDWYSAAAAGQSFVTTGPLLLLEVEGQRPGATIRHDAPGNCHVTARVRVLSEVAPVTHVQLIVGGRTEREWELPVGSQSGAWFEAEHSVTLRESGWIAARAWSRAPSGEPDAESHTNPVYVHLRGRAPFDAEAVRALISRIDGQSAAHEKRDFAERPGVLAYFRRSRDILQAVIDRGGLTSEEDPLRLVAQEDERPPAVPSDFDPSARTHSEEELREFLKPLPPRSPAEALQSFETLPGFEVQLVAAEPLVVDPVAAAIDEDGRMYVAELTDYPYLPPPDRKPLGSIKLLTDRDGDGAFDESTVFADGLLWPAAVAPWKGGLFVAAPPDIWYFRDDDGDGRADTRRRVFTGFGTKNPQGMVNNFAWGLDHRIYGATSVNGGSVRRGEGPDSPEISVSGRDFRFEPETLQFETVTGTVQFGNTFDDWGNRFLCSESQPLLHAFLPQEYLVRNPYLPQSSAVANLAPGPVPIFRSSPLERWRVIRSARRIAHGERPASAPGASHDVVDAAAGVTVYRGGAYPPDFYGTVFVGDAQNNLVHRRTLSPAGATFRSDRADPGTEFLRSTDNWFRPVNFVNAPDGTLYVLDLHREVLEAIHIPHDVVKHLDLTSGRNSGRIYRVAPAGFRSPLPPRLSAASGAELVAALESPHGWWRDTAHRLIYERQDRSLTPALRQLARGAPSAAVRLHALWSLEGLGTLDDADRIAALRDADAHVREHALRLSEGGLDRSRDLRAAALDLENDAEYRVRLQLMFSLGASQERDAAQALVRLVREHRDDAALRTAFMSSVTASAAGIFAELAADAAFRDDAAGGPLMDQLAQVVGAQAQEADTAAVLRSLSSVSAARPALAERWLLQLGEGLKRAGRKLPSEGHSSDPGVQFARRQFDAAARALSSAETPEAARQSAARLLGCFPEKAARDVLLGCVNPGEAAAVQAAAVTALGGFSDPRIATALLENWRGHLPAVRAQALQILLSRESWTLALLQAAEGEQISLTELDPTRREALKAHRHPEIASLAARLFTESTGSRQAVLEEYALALRLDGDPARGREVFVKNCATCHRIANEGHAVGPDLSTTASRDPAAMLAHLLDPNRFVLPNHFEYVVEDTDGRTHTGLLAVETATSLTLRRANGEEQTLLRSQVETIQSTGKSLMPEGLEKAISVPAMADLLAFLSTIQSRPPLDIGTEPADLVEPPRAP